MTSIVAAVVLALWSTPQASFSCAAVVASAPARDVLVQMSAASDTRLEAMMARVYEVGSRDGPNPSGADDVSAIVAEVQPDTDAFAAAFEASMCAQPPIPLTPEAELTIHQLGQNVRGAPTRMRDAALRGTPLSARLARNDDSGVAAVPAR